MKAAAENVAEKLNRECDCAVTDLAHLRQRIDDTLGTAPSIVQTHPHLFSEIPVFLDPSHVAEMRKVVEAVDAVIRLPDYRQTVLGQAPQIARQAPPTAGVFMGYDFHITGDGPKLIEINTNAGGAFLNIAARDAQRACCEAAGDYLADLPDAAKLEDDVMSMFAGEWSRARNSTPLRSIAIVDENPRAQFLYPEFPRARHLFESHGVRAHIVDPSELSIAQDQVRYGAEKIDLIYNRLTDFYFESPANHVVREAYERDLAVVTPHPHAHALYANKRNLALLSSAPALESFGASAQAVSTLSRGVPATREVGDADESWWNDRKAWFFKPRNGFGSRGAYRGDKLTRRVFAEIAKGEYMAQVLAPPGERWRSNGGVKEAFKVDVRCYVYDGVIQLMAARLYQGQTTNFRTAGGGFAAVYVIDGAG